MFEYSIDIMIPIYKSWLIQIDITNSCIFRCANCTRFVGHTKKPYFMDLADIEKAIDSLEGYQGGIGIIGGEPTMHPQFPEICELLHRKVSPYKCGLFTSGHKWGEYKKLIKKTFKFAVSYNDHSNPEQKHQPVWVAIDDVIEDKELMWRLIDKCWIQESWSPAINPKGAFFCEIAAAQDLLLDGPGGYPVEKGWWIKEPADFRDQVERSCRQCGAALPMECSANIGGPDTISPSNLKRLQEIESPLVKNGNYELFDKRMDDDVLRIKKSWTPGNYLGISSLLKSIPILKHVVQFCGEFKRKKDMKFSDLWLLNRGTYNLYRVWYRFRRKFFEKPPVRKDNTRPGI